MMWSSKGVAMTEQAQKHYRSIWISDFHLGTARCKAEALFDFLRRHCAENLYLVGDVIDGWNIGPGWCWNAAQTAVGPDQLTA
jgi:hypothetical protein